MKALEKAVLNLTETLMSEAQKMDLKAEKAAAKKEKADVKLERAISRVEKAILFAVERITLMFAIGVIVHIFSQFLK